MFLDAFKNPSKKIEMGIIKEKFEELQQTIYRKKKTGKKQIRLMKFLASFFYFLARIALTMKFADADLRQLHHPRWSTL